MAKKMAKTVALKKADMTFIRMFAIGFPLTAIVALKLFGAF